MTPDSSTKRQQEADYKAALDLQAKWFCEWQEKVRREDSGNPTQMPCKTAPSWLKFNGPKDHQ